MFGEDAPRRKGKPDAEGPTDAAEQSAVCEEQFAAGVARSGMRAVCMMLRRPSSTDSHSHRHIIMASSTLAQPARWPEAAASVSRAQHLDVSQGRIVLHQDFWDSAAGLYRNLPVVGYALKKIDRNMAD